ncbi:MAG TPA: RagB/SusD family nutrient uptake outer membrane protein [Bacteroidales bacterium]|nr:RagB/SusD family nutrient uptake outer membrane protein [Bacteroidales bacterium]
MKQYKFTILFGIMFALSFLNACDKNLDVKPTAELESEYFSDQSRMQRGMRAVYAKITDLYTYNANNPPHKLWLLPGDDLRSNNARTMDDFKGLAGSDGDINYIWNRLYQLINRANTMLQKIDENKNVYTDTDMIDYNRGEMYFIRGWAFYKLWSWWGKAPVVTDRVVGLSDKLYTPPSEGMAMLDSAIVDMENAEKLLPDSWPLSETGRAFHDGALGMLVKFYVVRACYKGGDAADYGKAISYFEMISSDRQLVTQFGENFDYRYENNSESLFEFQASEKPAQENPWLDNDFVGVTGSMGAFYQHFDNSWTNQGALVAPSLKLINAFDPNDPRLPETFQATEDGAWSFNGGFKMVKYVNGERNFPVGLGGINSANNTRILRLADVKLLAAEAYLETNSPDKALTQVNDIRDRARFSTTDGTEAAAPLDLTAVTMQDIMDERLRELAGEEGIRWFDLKRWNAAGYIDLSTWTKEDFGFPADYLDDIWGFETPTHLLMPIPVNEMDNNPKMLASGQNPGY